MWWSLRADMVWSAICFIVQLLERAIFGGSCGRWKKISIPYSGYFSSGAERAQFANSETSKFDH